MKSNEEKETRRIYIKSIIKNIELHKTIRDFQYILDKIWSNVFGTLKFDSYIRQRLRTCPGIIASIDTLEGIKELCVIEDYPDVYLLIRKLRDNLFLDLFLFEAQKTLEKIPDETFADIDFANSDEVMKAVNKLHLLFVQNEITKDEVEAINKWKDGVFLMNKDKGKGEYFAYSKYISYLSENNDYFKNCYKLFLKERLDNLNNKLNDYVHCNSESVTICRQKPQDILKDIKETLINLEHLFLISMFFVDSILFSSDTYMEYIECELEPPEGSQYWVDGFILEAFEQIKKEDKKLFDFLVEHNEYLMRIDADL